jgi:hypothetical protein
MARRQISLIIAGLLFLAGGCETTSRTGMVDRLPSPNFNAPAVLQPKLASAPVQPVTPTPAPRTNQSSSNLLADRAWIPAARANSWKWIVIHHSATPSGSASVFDKMHREKGWDELGYHFVIGNGTGSGNGQVEVGPRWPKQKWGAHAKTPDNRFNDYGIGICLVGNFDIERPTPQQMESLTRLVTYLMATYHIPPENVIGHNETKSTDCPGRNFNVAIVRNNATQMLARTGHAVDSMQSAGGRDLLVNRP